MEATIIKIIRKKRQMNVYDFPKEDLILRDFLALDRTILANERTFLAWFRTSLSLIAIGLTLIKFSDDRMFFIGGFILLFVGLLAGVVGTRRYFRMRKRLSGIKF